MFDINEIREQFPILGEKVYGKPLIYFDNGATTHRPRRVIEKMDEYYYKYNSNVHRGVHYLSNKCTDANEEAREVVRGFINAASTKEIIFTRGTTESINLVAYTFSEAFLHPGDEVLVTEMEHHANIVPWQMACERKGATLKVIPFNEQGELDLSNLDSLITAKTKILGIAYVSNVLGTVNPVAELIKKAHAVGAKVLVDAAQAIPHIPVDVQALDCDFLAFSGHKIYGPTGVGILYGKESLLEQLPPWHGGGEMIKTVTFAKTTYNELPFKFEAGTPDFIGIIGLGEALKFVSEIGMSDIRAHELALLNYAHSELAKIDGMRFYGTATEKSGAISFLVGDIHPFDLGTLLDHMGVAVRTGQLCAEPVMQHYGINGLVRASLGVYNTEQEVDVLVKSIKRAAAMF
ncbi:MAG: cysteine desulfurase [Marinifilaceae bacterium]|nr:cysteine desulfurase [Marinifilaceae bacterium]